MAAAMRSRLLALTVMSLPLFAACAGGEDDLPGPYDGDFPVSEDNVNEGAPDNDTLPDDNKADAVYPAKFQLGDQSPVKNQGSRGVCSIFASIALVENLYIKAGMPVAEADFSEQYLQWAAKSLNGSFKNTEGSSADANLETMVRYGTVKEDAWRYESYPWTSANDPACVGDNRPTRCYTNGEPPQSAIDAQKYKLPQKRWINTNSIKAHLTSKGSGVNVGMTFFYQAWNHRGSTLPIDADLWRKGIVTYPNAKDKQVSLENRAGHAITIIGWDDDLEVPMRDGDGKPVLDANGNPRMEKGFWLFKNSWGTTSFGIENPYGAGYGWLSYQYVKEYGSAVVAEMPKLEIPREVCDDVGEIDEDGDGQANCSDADCAEHPACQGGGGTAYDYSATPAAAIPDNDPSGYSSTIVVTDRGEITDAKITVDITHTWRGDLIVKLVKDSETIVLHDRSGGSADDLRETYSLPSLVGKQLEGSWTLVVSDNARLDTGTLNSWSLEVATR
jgi:hypothetical protein